MDSELVEEAGCKSVTQFNNLVSLSYGGIITIFPSMKNKLVGVVDGIKIYDFVFTAWGLSGLLMPLMDGRIFNIIGGYSIVILFLIILSIFPIILNNFKYRTFLI